MKTQTTDGENIFFRRSTCKGFISKIYKWLSKLNKNKTKNPIKIQVKDLNKLLINENIQMPNKYITCSSSLTLGNYNLKQWDTTIRMATIQKTWHR